MTLAELQAPMTAAKLCTLTRAEHAIYRVGAAERNYARVADALRAAVNSGDAVLIRLHTRSLLDASADVKKAKAATA